MSDMIKPRQMCDHVIGSKVFGGWLMWNGYLLVVGKMVAGLINIV